jgi:hypothetical protein
MGKKKKRCGGREDRGRRSGEEREAGGDVRAGREEREREKREEKEMQGERREDKHLIVFDFPGRYFCRGKFRFPFRILGQRKKRNYLFPLGRLKGINISPPLPLPLPPVPPSPPLPSV